MTFFSPSCIWNAKLTGSEPLDPASVRSVAKLVAANKARSPYINTTAYSSPVYTVPANQPLVAVTITKTYSPGLVKMGAAGVPIPPGAKTSAGTDRHMVIWQPATDTMWEFIGMHQDPSGAWLAGWGGKLAHASQCPGHYRNVFGPRGVLVEDKHWGSTACSLPMAAGIALISELQAGVIPHALSFAIHDCKKSVWVYPAQRTDGGDTAVDAIPEGARFRLDPALNLASLNLPPLTHMLAKAAQTYGLILNDRTLDVTTFRCEDPGPLTRAGQPNPYTKLFGGLSASQLAAAFPWSHLQQLAVPTVRP